MLVRRADVPRINKNMGIGSAGFWQGFYSLADAQKWEIVNYVDDQGVPAPRNSMVRCSRNKNFSIVARCAVRGAAVRDGRVVLDATRGRLAFDRVILATGLAVDWTQRPEFAALKPHVQLWRDHFAPDGSADYPQAEHPLSRRAFRISAARRRAILVGPHPLLQLCGHHEPRTDFRRYPGNQPRRRARRAWRRERVICRRPYAHLAAARRLEQSGLRGDEYVLDEDVGKFLANEPAEAKT